MALSETYHAPISLLGVSHHTLPVAQRERLTRASSEVQELLSAVVRDGMADEVALISTCNRFEVVGVGRRLPEVLRTELSRVVDGTTSSESVYHYADRAAVRHFLRVVSSLDSLVVGEAQILGQIKDSYRTSVKANTIGRYLHRLFQFGFRTAKRVRVETGIAEHGISVSYIAIKLAAQILGSLADVRAMLIGGGQMGELAALHLRSRACADIIVANRTTSRGTHLAELIGGSAIGISEIERHLSEVDIVIGSVAADKPILTEEQVRNALRQRARRRRILMIDLGVPRNFEESLGQLEDVFLYNVDDLVSIADQNKALRQQAAEDAEVIVQHALIEFEKWLLRAASQPLLVGLRDNVQSVCHSVVESELMKEGRYSSALIDRIVHKISGRLNHALAERLLAPGAQREKMELLLPLMLEEEEDDEVSLGGEYAELLRRLGGSL